MIDSTASPRGARIARDGSGGSKPVSTANDARVQASTLVTITEIHTELALHRHESAMIVAAAYDAK